MTDTPFHRPANGRDGAAAVPQWPGSRKHSPHIDVKSVRILHLRISREVRLGVILGIHAVVESDRFSPGRWTASAAAKSFNLAPAHPAMSATKAHADVPHWGWNGSWVTLAKKVASYGTD
jgi:hypothetical protein